MGWERRERGGLYFTRSRREGGRVVREYVGGGARGELCAMLDAAKRKERAEARAAFEAERATPEAVRTSLVTLGEELDALVATALEACGYHLRRGEWRRRRNGAARANAERHG